MISIFVMIVVATRFGCGWMHWKDGYRVFHFSFKKICLQKICLLVKSFFFIEKYFLEIVKELTPLSLVLIGFLFPKKALLRVSYRFDKQ